MLVLVLQRRHHENRLLMAQVVLAPLIGDFHDDIILLQQPESFFSFTFCNSSETNIPNLQEKLKHSSGCRKGRHRE